MRVMPLQMVLKQTQNTFDVYFSEALPALSYFQTRAVRPTAWKCQLQLGDDLTIPINLYKKVH